MTRVGVLRRRDPWSYEGAGGGGPRAPLKLDSEDTYTRNAKTQRESSSFNSCFFHVLLMSCQDEVIDEERRWAIVIR